MNEIAERAAQYGVHTLSDVEVLAQAARIPVDKARAVLISAGSVRKLLTSEELHGLTKLQHAVLMAGMEMTRRHYHELMTHGDALSNPRLTREYVRMRLRDLPHEVFCAIYLDNRNRVIGFQELFRGTIDGASVHPREVVKECLKRNAAAVILAHNHPSGVAEPSTADELITRRLKQALSLVDIRLLDHLIVGDGTCESFAERGLL